MIDSFLLIIYLLVILLEQLVFFKFSVNIELVFSLVFIYFLLLIIILLLKLRSSSNSPLNLISFDSFLVSCLFNVNDLIASFLDSISFWFAFCIYSWTNLNLLNSVSLLN